MGKKNSKLKGETVEALMTVTYCKINSEVRRLGGAYGGKITNPMPIAAAAALAAVRLNKPVRIVLDIETNIAMCSGRMPYLVSYEAGFDDTGKIHGLKMHVIANAGYTNTVLSFIEPSHVMHMVKSVYRADNWSVTPGTVTTNQPMSTACRAPGTTNAIAAIEMVMNHVAHQLNKDPWEVRQANFALPTAEVPTPMGTEQDNKVFSMMINEMFDKGDIKQRKAERNAFNKANRWRKRSLALLPMLYPVGTMAKMSALVSIYDNDGTVAVSHGGVEMGQGLNTKVAQVVARELGVPLDQVSVKPNNSLANPGSTVTGGSIGSEWCCMAARSACQQLIERLKPFRAAEGEPQRPWLQVVQMASGKGGVNLSAHCVQAPKPAGYSVLGLTAAEVELDVLTGENRFNRVDLYEDAGQSLSPWVDVGQIEGSFAMGMGLFLTERHRYDPATGQKLTNRAWNYYPPTHKDMPRDFRVKLLKNNKNDIGIFNSKATGEPAVCMSSVCLMALQQAVAAARRDSGHNDWVTINAPSTVEDTQMACQTSAEMFVLS
ncbi:xanthine dehydrogenase-like [Pollicipes pollicipes]|uniref:xanthine dehydrogenase-like n=1 Tax=Pollicipes pollicipes TaxID=41117 RepID=UPI001885116A|nr:xanthine dehydrogenase-like [Pollicipes pollicipes]